MLNNIVQWIQNYIDRVIYHADYVFSPNISMMEGMKRFNHLIFNVILFPLIIPLLKLVGIIVILLIVLAVIGNMLPDTKKNVEEVENKTDNKDTK